MTAEQWSNTSLCSKNISKCFSKCSGAGAGQDDANVGMMQNNVEEFAQQFNMPRWIQKQLHNTHNTTRSYIDSRRNTQETYKIRRVVRMALHPSLGMHPTVTCNCLILHQFFNSIIHCHSKRNSSGYKCLWWYERNASR